MSDIRQPSDHDASANVADPAPAPGELASADAGATPVVTTSPPVAVSAVAMVSEEAEVSEEAATTPVPISPPDPAASVPVVAGRDARFQHPRYTVRAKIFKLSGETLHVLGPAGEPLLRAEGATFMFKDFIRVYGDEACKEHLLNIRSRGFFNVRCTYDVFDVATGARLGSLRRRLFRSVMREQWSILGPDGRPIGCIREDHIVAAFFRRLLHTMIPQSYDVQIGKTLVATYREAFHLFTEKLSLDFSHDRDGQLERRLGVALGILMCFLECCED